MESATLHMQKQPEDLAEVWKEPYSGKKTQKKREFLHREFGLLSPVNMPGAALESQMSMLECRFQERQRQNY